MVCWPDVPSSWVILTVYVFPVVAHCTLQGSLPTVRVQSAHGAKELIGIAVTIVCFELPWNLVVKENDGECHTSTGIEVHSCGPM